MKKRTRSFLTELLLVFFALANFLIFSTAYGFYGANNLSITRIMPNQRNTADQRMKAAGIGWAREEFNWGLINPSKNRWNWANPDQAMATHRRNGVQVVGMLAYSATWASTNPRAGSNAQFYKPNITYWKNYVNAVARRYGDVTHWEIWNEPNFFWKPSPNVDEYREILVAAYDTIKAINPNAKVASGGLTYIDDGWVDALLDNGGWSHLDAVAVHYYPGVGPESDPNNKLRDELMKLEYETIVPHGGLKEIWITEMGWQSGSIGNQAQAEVISRAIIIARTVNEVPKILIYNLRDDPTGTYGLTYSNFAPKSSYNYYQKTIEFLGNRWPALLLELADGSKFYVFDGPGGPMAAAWNPDRTSEIFFHVNSSSINCYDVANQTNVDITSQVVKSWNNGDIVLQFKPRPIFCALSNFSAQNTLPKSNTAPQVAGVTDYQDNLAPKDNKLAHVSGSLQGMFGGLGGGTVTAYKDSSDGWQKYLDSEILAGAFNLNLPAGKYYLKYKIPGQLVTRTAAMEVAPSSNVNLQSSLFTSWIAYLILIGGVIVLILFVLKYSQRKR